MRRFAGKRMFDPWLRPDRNSRRRVAYNFFVMALMTLSFALLEYVICDNEDAVKMMVMAGVSAIAAVGFLLARD